MSFLLVSLLANVEMSLYFAEGALVYDISENSSTYVALIFMDVFIIFTHSVFGHFGFRLLQDLLAQR